MADTNKIRMEIIYSKKYERANIRFSEKPSEECRSALKDEGWSYSSKNNVWYPKNEAAASSLKFANELKLQFYPDTEVNPDEIMVEDVEKEELITLLQNGADVSEVVAKLNELYGSESILAAVNAMSSEKKLENDFLNDVNPVMDEIALKNKTNGNYIIISRSTENENDWYYSTYDSEYRELDGGVYEDQEDDKWNIVNAAKFIINDIYPGVQYSEFEHVNIVDLQNEIERIESEAYDRHVKAIQQHWEEHDNGVEQARDERDSAEMNAELRSSEEQVIRNAQGKLGDIVREVFLKLSDEEIESGTTADEKYRRYQKWYEPMVNEIMAEIGSVNKDVIGIVDSFNLDHEAHVNENKWYKPDEAFARDVQYKLLPELYEKVQDRIKANYDEQKIPYVVMFSSESPVFPSENKVYTIKEFNELILQADKEFHNRKEYAEKKYGSVENYWDLENEDKLPEEDKGIQFGYDKTNFKFFNIPNPQNPEDTFSYEPSRYDIGDGNGSIFDYVRSTCSHDDFIEALNELEKTLYFENVPEYHKEAAERIAKEEAKKLAENLSAAMEHLDKAQNDYKELHKNWLIEASEADRVDEELKEALDEIKETYDGSVKNVFNSFFKEFPPADRSLSLNYPTIRYLSNEAHKMVVDQLYLPSRNAQKAMNAEDYKTYNSFDWAKQRRIWELFPANVNIETYIDTILESTITEAGIALESAVEKTEAQKLTREEIEQGHAAALHAQAEISRKKYESEQGSNYDANLSTTDIAKNLREYIKKEHPGYKFSVTSRYFSGGSEISVNLTKTPVEIANFESIKNYCDKHSDIERYNDDKHTYEVYGNLSDEEKKDFVNRLLTNNSSFYSINKFHREYMDYMNPEVKEVINDVINHLESYNYDHSDSQRDYFDVNFYTSYGISDKAIEHSIELLHFKENAISGPERTSETKENVQAATKAEIVMNEKYSMPNLSFDGKPSEEMHEKLKEEGWLWNGKDSVWWPRTKEAQANAQKFAESVVNSYIEVPESLSKKLSSRNTIWFKGEDKTVKDMVDYLADINMSDFSLEKKDNNSLYIQGYDNGMKPRGRMEIDMVELQYLYNGMSNDNAKEILQRRFTTLTGKNLFENPTDIEKQTEEKSMEYPESSFQKISWVPLHNGRDTDYTYINGHSIERYFIWENKNGENEYSVSIDGEDLCFIDDETNEEHKLFFTESELNKQIINDTLYYGNSLNTIHKNTSTELTPEDIELCKKVIPPAQFKFTMELTEGEEGEFFKNKMKEIADTYRRINTDSELTNEDGTHTVGFRYFLGDTEIFLSEIDSDGIGFGYNILNGDLQMSEWGSSSLEEILSIPYMEMDYHVPEGITIEQMLYKEHPEYFTEYAPKPEVEQGKNADSYTNEIIEKIKAAGIEVVTDKDEYSKTLNRIIETNVILEMLEDNPLKIEKGRSQLNADSIPKPNYIIDIRNNQEYYVNKIELLKHKIENNEYNGKEFLELMQSELFSITDSKISGYYINEIENNFYKFRLSDHKAIISDRQGEKTLEESVVIQFCDNKGRVGSKGRLIEFYYNPENLTKEKMISIINGIQDWIKTGEFSGTGYDSYFISSAEEIKRNIFSQKMTAKTGLYWNGIPYEYEMAKYSLNSNLDINWLNHFFNKTNSDINQFNAILSPQEAQERLNELLKTAESMDYTGDAVSHKSNIGKNRLRTFQFFAEQLRNGNIGYYDRGAVISTGQPNWTTVNKSEIIVEPEYMFEKGMVIGLAYDKKIILNPDYLSSNAAVHEYTHLWDAYTQKTNPELWNKGLELFKNTKYWNEVTSDPNYQDIKDDENLVLSEIHSRICGDIAEQVLNRIAELDGEQAKLDAIDWDKETWNYIAENFLTNSYSYALFNADVIKKEDLSESEQEQYKLTKEKYKNNSFAAIVPEAVNAYNSGSKGKYLALRELADIQNNFYKEFLSTPMKDLIASKNITIEQNKELSWDELKFFFDGHLNELADFEYTKNDVIENEQFESETLEKDEAVLRLLDDSLDFHAYNNDGIELENLPLNEEGLSFSERILEEKYFILEQISAGIVDGRIKSIESAQTMLNDELLKSDLYKEVSEKIKVQFSQETKPYSFFINDVANLDLGIGAEIEPITGLTAEQAAVKYAELKEKGLNPYIGLNVPGDFIFDDKEGQGAGIFADMEGQPSFYIGDNFIKELKTNDEHAQNVIAAYKELYEAAEKHIPGTIYPGFLYEKEAEINGTKLPERPVEIYSFTPFGYEGNIVQVETDLRRGIPAVDIVGLADSAVKETRERIRAAFKNSDLQFPPERVLISLSPADIRKEGSMDVAIAMGILAQQNKYLADGPVLALGELELSGNIRPVRGAVAAVTTAKAAGITNVLCDPETAKLLKNIEGIKILTAENLKEAHEKMLDKSNFVEYETMDSVELTLALQGNIKDPSINVDHLSFEQKNILYKNLFNKEVNIKEKKSDSIEFNDELLKDEDWDINNLPFEGHFDTVRALEIAVAGKHNILTTGAPGCGKTMLTQGLIPVLTPKLTEEESKSAARIKSLSGLDSPKTDNSIAPFRIPHQTASIEGMCGGGINCRPGEISLAHNGTLFLDEAAEFRSSVLQMLRVPLESQHITLSRAGRSTTYPADFQLALAMNPCPCGNYGTHDKICRCSAHSIDQYWKKVSGPLLDRIEIKNICKKDESDKRVLTIDQMKIAIARAYEIQRKRGVYNSKLTPEEITKYCTLDSEGMDYLNNHEDELTPRGKANLLKTSLTIANMDGREQIQIQDMKEAMELVAPVFEKPRQFTLSQKDIDKRHSKEVHEEIAAYSVERFSIPAMAVGAVELEYERADKLSKEDMDYIYSDEFIEKFGDWRKAQRLEKLKQSKTLLGKSELVIDEIDVTDLVDNLRKSYSKENLKQLQKIAKDIGKSNITAIRNELGLSTYQELRLINNDTKQLFTIKADVIDEIDRHNLFEPGHIEALLSMKDLIENSIYVGSENNEDGRKPELVKFHYFAAGININNNDFTAKVVFTENNKGEFYYDQSLSTIEKGRFVDILQEKNKLETSSPQKKAEDSFELLKDANVPFEYYDKRLINICQVPQMPYLNKELLPTKETIEAVRNGQLKIEKSGQTYSMVDLRNTENAVESSLENYKTRHQKKWLEFEDNRKNSNELGQMEFDFDDPGVTQEVISAAEKERKRITEPVLNGEKTGMYVAFKEFEEKGVFDIKGKQVRLGKNGKLTPVGWKQLQAAMEIYRSKKFETFRYILVDEKGEIKDQLAITSHLPNFCNVSFPNDETLKQVISRAEEINCKIAVCHNHPSGNTTESSFDHNLTESLNRSLCRRDGKNLFLGHIILDHDTFNVAVPGNSKSGSVKWKTMEPLNVTSKDRFTPDNQPVWADNFVGSSYSLLEVAKKINDTDNWNDDYIPVVFSDTSHNVTALQYYSKSFFENDSEKIRNELSEAAKTAGAIGAMPVITDYLWNKLGNEAGVFEEKMKEHVMNDAFIDVAYNQTTITDKYDINPGRNFYNLYHDNSDRNIDVEASWKPEINASLFPPEENVSRTVGDVGEAAKNYNASSNLFTRDFLKQYNFMPPVLLRENEAVVRCNSADLNPRYVRLDVPAGKSVDITIPKQFLMDSIMAGIKTEAERVIKYNDEHPDNPDKLQLAGMCLNEDNLFEQQKQLLKDNGINNPKDMIEAVNSMRQQLFFGENSIFNSIPVKDNSKEKEQEIEEEGFDR